MSSELEYLADQTLALTLEFEAAVVYFVERVGALHDRLAELATAEAADEFDRREPLLRIEGAQ